MPYSCALWPCPRDGGEERDRLWRSGSRPPISVWSQCGASLSQRAKCGAPALAELVGAADSGDGEWRRRRSPHAPGCWPCGWCGGGGGRWRWHHGRHALLLDGGRSCVVVLVATVVGVHRLPAPSRAAPPRLVVFFTRIFEGSFHSAPSEQMVNAFLGLAHMSTANWVGSTPQSSHTV